MAKKNITTEKAKQIPQRFAKLQNNEFQQNITEKIEQFLQTISYYSIKQGPSARLRCLQHCSDVDTASLHQVLYNSKLLFTTNNAVNEIYIYMYLVYIFFVCTLYFTHEDFGTKGRYLRHG